MDLSELNGPTKTVDVAHQLYLLRLTQVRFKAQPDEGERRGSPKAAMD